MKLKKRKVATLPQKEKYGFDLVIKTPPTMDTTLLEKRRYLVCSQVTISGIAIFDRNIEHQLPLYIEAAANALEDFNCTSIKLHQSAWCIEFQSQEMEPYKKLEALVNHIVEQVKMLMTKVRRIDWSKISLVQLDVQLTK